MESKKLFKAVFNCDKNESHPVFIVADDYVDAVKKLYEMDDFDYLCDELGFDISIAGEALI